MFMLMYRWRWATKLVTTRYSPCSAKTACRRLWKARNAKLDGQIAIKVLPVALAHDPDTARPLLNAKTKVL